MSGTGSIIRDGLSYYYDFSNPKCYPSYGSTVTSLHNTSVTGTLTGNTTFEGNGPSGMKFDGTADYIGTNITIDTTLPTATYDAWFNVRYLGTADGKANSWNTIMDSGTERPLIGFVNGALYVYPNAHTSYTITANTWNHLQVVFRSNSSYDVWLNGTKVVSGGDFSAYGQRTGTFQHWLGGDSGAETSDSWIAWAAVYNRALTDAEVIQNHTATSPRFSSNSLLGSKNNPATSPQQLQDAGYPSGAYWIQGTGMSSAVSMIVRMRYIDGRPWVLGFASPYRSTATVNLVGNSIPWRGFAVQRQDTTFRQTGYYATNQTFNSRSDTTVAPAGTNAGTRVFIGSAGGMGFYTTSQNPCSWSSTNLGAVGAGYNGSTCGSFPNDLVWGTGNNSSATYDNQSGNWEVLIWWD